MPFIKQKSGLMDKEDYFITGSFTDFLGGGVCRRKDGILILEKGEIKRNFIYEEFAAVVKAENQLSEEAVKRIFFVETNMRRLGICEEGGAVSKWWKITMSDNFVQTFTSEDGVSWENMGGSTLEEGERALFLGFCIEKSKDSMETLQFSSCTAYAAPFLKVFNFPENFIVKLLDSEGGALKTEPFDANMAARIVLDTSVSARLGIYNAKGEPVYESETFDFEAGDEYLYTEYSLELSKGEEIFDYGPNNLGETKIHLLSIKNTADVSCGSFHITATGRDSDMVGFSADGTEFSAAYPVSGLEPEESIDFYVKIDGGTETEFSVYEFEITII